MPAAALWIGDGPSVPCGDIARCNKGCNPPYHLGLGQEFLTHAFIVPRSLHAAVRF